jgi:hypothetical protein
MVFAHRAGFFYAIPGAGNKDGFFLCNFSGCLRFSRTLADLNRRSFGYLALQCSMRSATLAASDGIPGTTGQDHRHNHKTHEEAAL